MNLIVRPSDVEILDAPTVQITVARHPFGAKAHVATVRGGMTVAELVAEHWHEPRPCAVTADGERIEKGRWGEVIPRETVEMVGVPQGPLLAIFTAISKAFSAAFSAIGGLFSSGGLFSGLGGKLLQLGLSMAARYLLNALFAPSKPQLQQDQSSPTYSIGGARNEVRQFAPVPVILGTHRVSPAYAAPPYTENIGDDQYLRAVFCWGHGPLNISDIKIGETPIASFDGVTTQTRQGYPSDAAITLYPAQVFQEDLNVELIKDQANVRTTIEDTDEIIVDVTAPNGLYSLDEHGDMWSNYVDFKIEYRHAGSGSYTLHRQVHLSAKSRRPIRRSYKIDVPRGTYDVRVTRTSRNSPGVPDEHDDTYIDDLYWTALRSIRDEPPLAADVPLALTGIRIKASAQLNGQIETLNGLVTSRVKSWNGSSWVDDTPSNNPADLYRHVLQCSANRRPVDDSLIDLDNLAEWHEFCDEHGYTFNQVRDFTASVWETLRDIAAAGRAVPTFVDGKWSVVWDDPDAPVVQHFSPANSSGFTGQRAFLEEIHALRVRFINEKKGYLQDERIVYDDGYDKNNATKFLGIEFPGVTDPDQIWKLGRYHLAQLKLRRETYELTTDWEHLVCTKGDRVRVTHDVPKWGLGFGRVKIVRANGLKITLTDYVAMEAGKNYVIRFRLKDGTSSLRSVVNEPGTLNEITLVADGGEPDPEPGDLYQFGEMGRESTILRVKAIRPGPDLSARLTLEDDAPEIYEADQGTIPDFDPNISEPVDLFSQPPTDVRAVEVLYLDGARLASRAEVSWKAPSLGFPSAYMVQMKEADDEEWSAPVTVRDTGHSFGGLSQGSYRFRVQAVYGNVISRPSAEAILNVVGPNQRPADVTGFRAATSGTNLILSWDRQEGVIVADYEIRFAPRFTNVAWQSAATLAQGVQGNSYLAPFARGTYLIKARSYNDIYSANATANVVAVVPNVFVNVVETVTEDPDWEGTFDKTHVDNVAGGVRLDDVSGDPVDGVEPEGFYYFANPADLGEVFTAKITANITAEGLQTNVLFFDGVPFFSKPTFFSVAPAAWNVTLQLRYTSDDPEDDPEWSEWEDAVIGDYTGRAFEFRLKLLSFSPQVTPLVTAASVTLDMPDRIIAAEDVESTTNGVTITFDPPFRVMKALNVTGQDMATGDYFEITGKDETGFTITFFDSSGTKINRTFDYQAIGYGAVIE